MADEKQSGTGVGGNSLVLWAIAAVSAVYLGWQKPALETFRPTEAEHQVHSIGDIQDVDARLWQDPLGAVARYVDDDPKSRNTRARIHGVQEFVSQSKRSQTLVIGVTLPGGRYPVEIEERRRLRYAVVAALHVAKYTPQDAEHIGYLHIDETQNEDPSGSEERVVASLGGSETSSPVEGEGLPSEPMNVPFEWFSSLAGAEPSRRGLLCSGWTKAYCGETTGRLVS